MRLIAILLLLVYFNANGLAQTTKRIRIDSNQLALVKAKNMANPNSLRYNPEQAFLTYKKYAEQGNPEAMNGLANLYNNGLGTDVNEAEAFKWYHKAASAGYSNAWFNIGNSYKMGIGVPVNYKEAYNAFLTGSNLNNPMCYYGQGYMLYKGLGISQSYDQAAILFKKGAQKGDASCMYMLGLCYQNGYGIGKNPDSARIYLRKAAARRDARAIQELQNFIPENNDLAIEVTPQPPKTIQTPIKLKDGFKKIKQNISKNGNISGKYEGYLIKFDWSGKHIIEQNKVTLNLDQRGKQITGFWEENGEAPIRLNGLLADTALIFSQTEQKQADHYHKNKLLVKFESSHINVVQSRDTVYLSGNINVYAPVTKEPEKPRLIMLARTDALGSTLPVSTDAKSQQAQIEEEERLDAEALHFIAYPNPFITNTSFRYTLRRPARTNILITDILTGKTVYRSQNGLQQVGDYTLPITLNSKPGNYVVSLQYNNKIKSLIVIKN